MFRHDKLDMADADFGAVPTKPIAARDAIRAATGAAADEELTSDGRGLLMAIWSIVHGFAHLALGGKLRTPGRERVGKE